MTATRGRIAGEASLRAEVIDETDEGPRTDAKRDLTGLSSEGLGRSNWRIGPFGQQPWAKSDHVGYCIDLKHPSALDKSIREQITETRCHG
jgi:hypothetical protein